MVGQGIVCNLYSDVCQKCFYKDFGYSSISYKGMTSIMRLLVKCGTAECGMRKVKCGMETVEGWCGTVGKMRNAEICECLRSFVHS